MLDPRREAILIRERETGIFQDKTGDVARYTFSSAGQKIDIVFTGQNKPFSYGPDRVRILHRPVRRVVAGDDRVEVNGTVWHSASEIVTFTGHDGSWCRVFNRTRAGEKYWTYPATQVRVVTSATATPLVHDILRYWRKIVGRLDSRDPLRKGYDRLSFVHPESALSSYLTGTPIASEQPGTAAIFPFRCNLSQREAVDNALTRSVSVISGPPGTGKTETILNLIANIVALRHQTVAIVSFGNAAVDNIRQKLDELGFSHLLANLGRRQKREQFFAAQEGRNTAVGRLVTGAPQAPDLRLLADLDRRLRELQEHERRRAARRQELDAHRLELRHFQDHLRSEQLPDLTKLPLLKKGGLKR